MTKQPSVLRGSPGETQSGAASERAIGNEKLDVFPSLSPKNTWVGGVCGMIKCVHQGNNSEGKGGKAVRD